ncbi:MAG: Sec-independent protein translocase subunit TatA [Methylacidiphilales bacterium]|nr:Sec-independent protein translocase subunit TatA [Candidatus Methylacidiphilales bacterium]
MGAFSVTHLIILLVIVILIFGTSKIKDIGADLGSAVKNFKKGLQDNDTAQHTQSAQSSAHSEPVKKEEKKSVH